MDYYNISLNNIYLFLSFNNKNKTTFIYLISLSFREFISLYYLLINLIIYLLLKFKKNSIYLKIFYNLILIYIKN
jgi:hypothetical protein